jgi:hypothetical protein
MNERLSDTTLAGLQAMMAECGPRIPEIDAVVQSPDGEAWGLQLDDDSLVYMRHDEPHQRIRFATDVGRPDAQNRMRTLEALLTFNILWQGELNIRMALSPDDDNIVQMCVLPAEVVRPEVLPRLIPEFKRMAGAWREAIEKGCHGDDAAAIALQFNAFAIRV